MGEGIGTYIVFLFDIMNGEMKILDEQMPILKNMVLLEFCM